MLCLAVLYRKVGARAAGFKNTQRSPLLDQYQRGILAPGLERAIPCTRTHESTPLCETAGPLPACTQPATLTLTPINSRESRGVENCCSTVAFFQSPTENVSYVLLVRRAISWGRGWGESYRSWNPTSYVYVSYSLLLGWGKALVTSKDHD